MSRRQVPDKCAICGAPIPRSAHACPECGADEQTGWREQSVYDNLDLPDTESGTKPKHAVAGVFWKIVGFIVLVIVAVLVLRGRL